MHWHRSDVGEYVDSVDSSGQHSGLDMITLRLMETIALQVQSILDGWDLFVILHGRITMMTVAVLVLNVKLLFWPFNLNLRHKNKIT